MADISNNLSQPISLNINDISNNIIDSDESDKTYTLTPRTQYDNEIFDDQTEFAIDAYKADNNYNIINKGQWNNINNNNNDDDDDDFTYCDNNNNNNNNNFISNKKRNNKNIEQLDDTLFNIISEETIKWFIYQSVVQYEYNFYQSLNTTTSVIIILLSSLITLLEGIKSTTELNIHYSLISLLMSFFIALIASLVKFFNFQQTMEILKTVIDNLDNSYVEGNELFNRYHIYIKRYIENNNKCDDQIKMINDFWNDWQRISNNTVRPLSNVSKLIDPQIIVIYKDRFFQQQELEENITNKNYLFKEMNEKYLNILTEKGVKRDNIAKELNNVHYTIRRHLDSSKLPKSKVKWSLKKILRTIFG
jgi:hypothetical protein